MEYSLAKKNLKYMRGIEECSSDPVSRDFIEALDVAIELVDLAEQGRLVELEASNE